MRLSAVILLALLLFSHPMMAQETSPDDSISLQYQPGDHELIFMPTAYTMEEGSGYFSDYELFFLNLSWAPAPRTHVGTMFLFPITTAFLESITLGAKQNYFKTEMLQSALFGTYTVKNGLYTIGNVISIGRKSLSLHVGFAWLGQAKLSETALLMLAGTRIDISRRLSGFVEYTNAKELLDRDFKGILTLGIRFRGDYTAWELAGFRPLESTGELLFIPFLKATFLF